MMFVIPANRFDGGAVVPMATHTHTHTHTHQKYMEVNNCVFLPVSTISFFLHALACLKVQKTLVFRCLSFGCCVYGKLKKKAG